LLTGESDPYEVISVNVKRVPTLILVYAVEPTGEVLPHNDNKVLPGDYSALPLSGKAFLAVEHYLTRGKDVPNLEAGELRKLPHQSCLDPELRPTDVEVILRRISVSSGPWSPVFSTTGANR
jgi:hypothetical protein